MHSVVADDLYNYIRLHVADFPTTLMYCSDGKEQHRTHLTANATRTDNDAAEAKSTRTGVNALMSD